jgi:hypothetical protein
VWTVPIDAGAPSAPIAYQAKDGRQCIVLSATVGVFLGDKSRADAVIAYSPREHC